MPAIWSDRTIVKIVSTDFSLSRFSLNDSVLEIGVFEN